MKVNTNKNIKSLNLFSLPTSSTKKTPIINNSRNPVKNTNSIDSNSKTFRSLRSTDKAKTDKPKTENAREIKVQRNTQVINQNLPPKLTATTTSRSRNSAFTRTQMGIGRNLSSDNYNNNVSNRIKAKANLAEQEKSKGVFNSFFALNDKIKEFESKKLNNKLKNREESTKKVFNEIKKLNNHSEKNKLIKSQAKKSYDLYDHSKDYLRIKAEQKGQRLMQSQEKITEAIIKVKEDETSKYIRMNNKIVNQLSSTRTSKPVITYVGKVKDVKNPLKSNL